MENKAHFVPLICPRKVQYSIVKSQYEYDIIFNTQRQGGTEAEGNKNNIPQINGI